ncbi:Protein kinase-like domain protein [Beauveria brongniartii RCEF 3172]|uniref:Protein kinase-like domain protein n=1 Tax=Beauveria brongniartii RCEF 3172 TaxID=1081107 RepID=A0A167IE26_9HYPO|nr:Protein kinase-like domain protein [Beauveria brongniartii RCEF 3172]
MDLTHRLFSLRPRNAEAGDVLHRHADIVSPLMEEDALDFGHFKSNANGENNRCIATLGSQPAADILVPKKGTSASDVQCEFLVSNDNCIEFVDKSSNVSCRVYGGENGDISFLSSNCRQAYSSSRLCRIEFKIDQSNWADFDIIWHHRPSLASALEARRNAELLPRTQPPMADTQVMPATDLKPESQRLPPYVADTSPTRVARYERDARPLGRGNFGVVFRVKDPKTNQFYAVKEQPGSKEVKREIEILKSLRRHPNIVRFHRYEYFNHDELYKEPPVVHIFMDLMEGSLYDMVEQKRCPVQLDDDGLARVVYHNVLKGLDYMHSKGFIHRDLKPANILWTLRNGKLSFCIADFGVSNSQSLAKSTCGTPIFTAPEYTFRCPQTTAMDLWSLFITVLWTANLDDFRAITWQNNDDRLLWVASLAKRRWNDLAAVQELVVLDPKDRATASQMLVKGFGGKGLTTRRKDVPKLPTVMAPEIKSPSTGVVWLHQLVRPGDMPAQEPIDEKVPGIHIFTRLAIWTVNKEKNVQVVNEQFESGGGIIVAPEGKVSRDCPRSPVAGQPRVTKHKAAATKRLVIRAAVVRGIRCQTKGRPASGAWSGQLQQTPGFFPG